MTVKINRRNILVGVPVVIGALAISFKNGLAAKSKTHNVKIKSFKFEPQQIAVKIGDKISWINEDLAPHTATATQAGWDTGEITKGESKTIEVTEGMETTYFCAFHPHMKGMIKIVS